MVENVKLKNNPQRHDLSLGPVCVPGKDHQINTSTSF